LKRLRELDPGLLIMRRAVRSTAAVFAGCFVCLSSGASAELAFVYLAAYFVTIVDIPGPLPTRLRLLLGTTALLAVCAEWGAAVADHAWLVALSVAAVSLGAALLGGVYMATPIGIYGLILFIVGTAVHPASPGLHALWVGVGGVMSAAATSLLLPVRRDAPSWLQLGRLMGSLGDLLDATRARNPSSSDAAALDVAGEARLNAFFSDLRRALSEAMARATPRTRGDEALHGFARVARRIVSSLAAIESMRSGLVHAGRGEAQLTLLDAVYEEAAGWLHAKARQVQLELPRPLPERAQILALRDRLDAEAEKTMAAARQDPGQEDEFLVTLGMRRMVEGLCLLIAGLEEKGWKPPADEPFVREPLAAEMSGTGWRSRLGALLRPESSAVGHGMRLATASLISLAAGPALHLDRSYWTSITVVLVLQASFGDTLRSTLTRAVATLLGCAASLGILALHPSSTTLTAIELACVFLANASMIYGKLPSVFFVTVIVITAIAGPAASPEIVARLRVENTLLGCVIVLVAIFFVWPRWTRDRVPRALSSALRSVASFAGCVAADHELGRHTDRVTAHARGEAYGRLDDLSQLLRIALREPGASSGRDDAWLGLLLGANRVFGIFSILSDHLATCALAHDAEIVDAYARIVTETLGEAADVIEGRAATIDAPLPADLDAALRMLRERMRVWINPTVDAHVRLLLQLRALLWEMERVRAHVRSAA
jgi:uncharacterized membrane protein YccC